jgi:hypothetical protein
MQGHPILIDMSADVFLAVPLVLSRHELMSVPCEIDVKGWDNEVARGTGHQIQEIGTVSGKRGDGATIDAHA